MFRLLFFFFQAEDGIRDRDVTGVQTCALPISLTPGKRFSSGISQSVKARPEVTEARNDHLPWMSQVLKPGVPFSTRNPRIFTSSHLAQTTATLASDPLVIHI